MNKKTIIIIAISAVLVLGLAAGGFIWWTMRPQAPSTAGAVEADQAAKVAQATAAVEAVSDLENTVGSINDRVGDDLFAGTEAATTDVSVGIPDVNPLKDTNPFSGIRTNPFK